MATNIVRRLPTALQIATARARQIARAEFAKRLDAAAYRCTRDGASWIAEGAGQRFDFSKTDENDVLVMSHTGGIYLLMVGDDGELTCDCPSSRRSAAPCKHLVAFDAVRMAYKMSHQPLTDEQREELLAGAEGERFAA